MLVGFVFLAGCSSHPPANVKPISLAIFEVVECKTGGAPAMSVKGSTEKYCLAAKPVVDETDIRHALPRRGNSGKPELALYFTLKAGQRMRVATERISAAHQQRNDLGKMGLVIDGMLVKVPSLTGVVSDSLVIDGEFSWEDAVQIAESLNARKTP